MLCGWWMGLDETELMWMEGFLYPAWVSLSCCICSIVCLSREIAFKQE